MGEDLRKALSESLRAMRESKAKVVTEKAAQKVENTVSDRGLYKVVQWQKVTYLVQSESNKEADLAKALSDSSKCIGRIGLGELASQTEVVSAAVATLEDITNAEPVSPDLKVVSGH